ncbi:hypothetical protein V5740_13230 [Croceibacterium sp. TMG7-5b_MA50]|uniref:hypothetical protein n=1 Tax=Croceibacterium sp. TMG7-5b_MA50 TaxID=3121290 RepID=UPI003221AFFF
MTISMPRRRALGLLAMAPVACCARAEPDIPRPPAPEQPIAQRGNGGAGAGTLLSGALKSGAVDAGTDTAFRIRKGDPVRGVRLHDLVTAASPEWLLDCSPQGSLEDAMIERVAARCGRGCIRIRGTSARVLVRDVQAGGSVIRDRRRLPGGMVLSGDASDITIERVSMSGFRSQWADDRYWNGDGFATERGNRRIVIRDCSAIDNTDGGFDMKAADSQFAGINLAQGNARNFRFWSSWEAATLVSLEPVRRGGRGGRAHFGIYGKQAEPRTLRIERLVARAAGDNRAPLFKVEATGPVTVIVGSHDLALPPGTPLLDKVDDAAVEFVWHSGEPRL